MTAAGTSTQPAARGPEFTPEEIDRALTALALNGGNSTRAVHMLEQDDTLNRVPDDSTLRVWRTRTHAERYVEIRDQLAPQIEAAAVHDYRAIVARTNQIHIQALEQTAAGIDDLDAKDAAATVKNLAIAGGVAADKLLVFTDRPNQITQHRDPDQILRQLEGILGSAEEVPSEALIAQSHEANPRELDAGTTHSQV